MSDVKYFKYSTNGHDLKVNDIIRVRDDKNWYDGELARVYDTNFYDDVHGRRVYTVKVEVDRDNHKIGLVLWAGQCEWVRHDERKEGTE